jgi:hypothetical protein
MSRRVASARAPKTLSTSCAVAFTDTTVRLYQRAVKRRPRSTEHRGGDKTGTGVHTRRQVD